MDIYFYIYIYIYIYNIAIWYPGTEYLFSTQQHRVRVRRLQAPVRSRSGSQARPSFFHADARPSFQCRGPSTITSRQLPHSTHDSTFFSVTPNSSARLLRTTRRRRYSSTHHLRRRRSSTRRQRPHQPRRSRIPLSQGP